MRKYAISKSVYIIWIAILLFLSIGYTYAYFSAIDTVTTNGVVHDINVSWRDENANDALLSTWFNDVSSIALSSELTRGDFVQIKALNKDTQLQEVKLKMANFGSTGAYCRIKITATYVNNSDEQKTCDDDWFELALADGTDKNLITDNGWFYHEGYYYYGANVNNLTELSRNSGVTVADYIKLSTDSDADIYGANISMTLTLEAVQSSNQAYKYIWGIGTIV